MLGGCTAVAEVCPIWRCTTCCPAHVTVGTEWAYMVVRILQPFKAIESRDTRPYAAVMRAGPSNKHGVKVAFMQAE